MAAFIKDPRSAGGPVEAEPDAVEDPDAIINGLISISIISPIMVAPRTKPGSNSNPIQTFHVMLGKKFLDEIFATSSYTFILNYILPFLNRKISSRIK